MSFKTITDTGIQNLHSNGGRSQTIIFKNDKDQQFKICILSESYKPQSYARLYKWTDTNGFSIITAKNPVSSYNIDISYQQQYRKNAFDPIIKDLQEIASHF